VFRVGEKRAIGHTVRADEPFAIDSVTATIYTSAGSTIVNDASGTITAVSATEYQLAYVWDTTGRAAGDYVYQLRYQVDAEELLLPGLISLLPVTSKYDPWVQRVLGWIAESKVSEAQRQLSYVDVMQALQAAISRYELDQPRRILETVSLSAGQFEYDVPSGWVEGRSRIQALEYPVQDTSQTRTYLDPSEWAVDGSRAKWRFTCQVPSAGETARLLYSGRHTLSHTEDTLPAQHFEAVSMYAAGEALLTLANLATQSTGPGYSADAISYRTKQQEYQSQARELRRWAETMWGHAETPQPFTTWRFFLDHGFGG